MNYTAKYKNRKKYEIYDGLHAVLYLNEQSVDPAKNNGACYSYSGPMTDGGTMVSAEGVTAENCRDKLVAGLIGLGYDMDAQIAVLANGENTPEHAAELAAFMATRAEAKRLVDEMLAREL